MERLHTSYSLDILSKLSSSSIGTIFPSQSSAQASWTEIRFSFVIFSLFPVCRLEVDSMTSSLISLFKVVAVSDDWSDGCLWNVEFSLAFIAATLDGELFDDLARFFLGISAAALPKVTKTIKPQAPKVAGKGAKQSVGKKNNQNLNKEEESGDKNDKTKPQVTHELSMVRFLSMKLVTVRSAVAVNRLTLSVAGLVFN